MINLVLSRVVLPAAALAAGWFWLQANGLKADVAELHADKAALEVSLASMTRAREDAELAADVARAHAKRLLEAEAELSELKHWIAENDDDTPIPAVLRGAIDRLRAGDP